MCAYIIHVYTYGITCAQPNVVKIGRDQEEVHLAPHYNGKHVYGEPEKKAQGSPESESAPSVR